MIKACPVGRDSSSSSLSSYPSTIPIRVMSAYFFSPSSWVSLTQLRNFERPQGYPSIPQGFPTSILQDIPTSILQNIPTSILQDIPTSILQSFPTSIPQGYPSIANITQQVQAVEQLLKNNHVPTEWICITFLVLFGISTGRVPSVSSIYRS